MRVVVLGAGLLGVTSAYYLQQLGHQVTAVDRHATPAAKARGRVDADITTAAAQLLRQSTARRAARAKWVGLYVKLRRHLAKLLDRAIGEAPGSMPIEHLVRLGAYSRDIVRALRDEAGVPPGQRNPGLLSVYTDAEAFNARLAHASHWHGLGCEERLISAEEALHIEPALQGLRGKLAGATYLPDEPAARDPAQFAASMVFLCRAAGVRFLTKHTVISLKERAGRIDHVELLDADGEPVVMRGQAYVLALGISSAIHAEKLKIPMPLRFLREYIVTIPLKDGTRAPRVALRDRQGKLRIRRIETPNGDCLRVSATVRASLDEENEPDSDRVEAILRRIETLLPGAADTAHASLETVVHAVSRDGLPMIGKTRLFNLFLNAAPGARGWINACGAGKSIARIVSGLRPELEFAFRNP
ncbi:FAD-dependent oxidoreductase [Variovorax paradoxus]|nr:FAD-dependent oxidoreductase [Variovorax paradoxus]